MAKRVSIQGQEASFHAIAAKNYFGNGVSFVPCETFAETFGALKSGKAEAGVVAIENSLFGSINEVYDLLLNSGFWISGEIYLRVKQCLIGLPEADIKHIKEVHSHPVALAQCEEYLDKVLPSAERFEHHDTAGSVESVKNWADPAKAAIASAEAAKLHGMKVLADEIETNKQNYTRFVVIEPKETTNKQADKTSLILGTDHKPGALYNALGAFAKHGINLTKLQSRPIAGQAWHYMFYIDIDIGTKDSEFKEVLEELNSQNCETTVLGSYRAAKQA